jgi:phosphatidylserine/phosphatidylglycerophosphate/cardiolipin synthase-like enzyme
MSFEYRARARLGGNVPAKKEKSMKSIVLGLVLTATTFLWGCAKTGAQAVGSDATKLASIEVYFSPRGGAAEAIIKQIDAAKTSILVQAYSFDYLPIAKALVAARQRNLEVAVLLDKDKTSEEKSAAVNLLAHSDVPVRLDGVHHTAHNKTIIIDSEAIITGSFNFTKHSEQDNAENVLVIRDKTLAAKYAANWKVHAEHSTPYGVESAAGSAK